AYGELGGHTPDDEWHQEIVEGVTYHYHKCEITGCEEKLSRAACNDGQDGATATCREKAICTTCNTAYGELGGHTPDDEWHQEIVEGVTYHYHKCEITGCEEKLSREACAPGETGEVATCSHAARCGTCNTQYGSVNPNMHDCITYTDKTATKHTVVYGCGGVDSATEDHNWNNGVCTACEYECTHDIESEGKTHLYASVGNDQHTKTCVTCGLQETESCSGGSANCTDLAVCDFCETSYGQLNATVHKGTLQWNKDDTYHEQVYVGCACAPAVAKDEHDFENGVCAICEYECNHDDFAPAYTSNGNGTHKVSCSKCGKVDSESRNCNDALAQASCHNLAKCSLCETEWGTMLNHTPAAEYSVYVDEETGKQYHYYACTSEGCTAKLEVAECAGGSATCQTAAICVTCEHTYGTAAEHQYSTEATQIVEDGVYYHYYACIYACGEYRDKEACDGVATCMNKAVCSVCGEYGEIDEDNHALDTFEYVDNGDGTHTKKHACCKSVVETVEHTYVWTYDDTTDATKHTGLCACGDTSEGAHTYDQYVLIDVEGESMHITGCVCGKADPTLDPATAAEAHTGGTATCLNKAVCSVCHNAYGDVDLTNHDETCEPVWTKTATTHTAVYTCGETAVAEEGHEWENGVCTECGYTCEHTGGTATCKDKAVCTECGASYGELNADNHASTDYTYTVNGSDATKHDKKHSCCGVLVETVAHTYGDWEETKAATTTEKGEKKHTCTACGAVETAEIDVLSSDDSNQAGDNNGDNTNDEKNNTVVVVIIVCAAVVVVGAIIAVCVVASKKKKAAKLAAAQKPWRTKQTKKKKWKKKK
ncbi:MAG: hypothetical protein IJX39_01250, partial [Clostridia bacterium]|nr:hypothetical protein [Clostridia bacterium]